MDDSKVHRKRWLARPHRHFLNFFSFITESERAANSLMLAVFQKNQIFLSSNEFRVALYIKEIRVILT